MRRAARAVFYRFPWVFLIFAPSKTDFSELALRAKVRRMASSKPAAVSELTGMSLAELDDLGGF